MRLYQAQGSVVSTMEGVACHGFYFFHKHGLTSGVTLDGMTLEVEGLMR